MYKCYIGVGHARFRMSANLETWPEWCDGCRAEVIHRQASIRRGLQFSPSLALAPYFKFVNSNSPLKA